MAPLKQVEEDTAFRHLLISTKETNYQNINEAIKLFTIAVQPFADEGIKTQIPKILADIKAGKFGVEASFASPSKKGAAADELYGVRLTCDKAVYLLTLDVGAHSTALSLMKNGKEIEYMREENQGITHRVGVA